MIAAFLLLLGAPAHALDVPICVTYDLNFDDSDADDDFWDSGVPSAAARGILIVVTRVSNLQVVGSAYANESAPDIGCHTFALTSGVQYAVTVSTEASIAGNLINVYANDINFDHYADTVLVTPTTTATVPIETADERWWQMAAAAGWAIHRNDGADNRTYYIFDESCCNNDITTGFIYARTRNKFIVSHELGHRVLRYVDENSPAGSWYDVGTAACDNGEPPEIHEELSKEWQSSAFVEGWADVYSAVAWNDRTESNCTYNRHYGRDVDLDNDDDYGSEEPMTCEGDPCTSTGRCDDPAFMDDEDWLEDLVAASDVQGCTGTLVNRSSQYDWLRLGWKLITVEGLTVNEVWTLMDTANPNDWDPNASDAFTINDPLVRFGNAATALGSPWSTAWSNQTSNGQDH
jgi:hypothetical protein